MLNQVWLQVRWQHKWLWEVLVRKEIVADTLCSEMSLQSIPLAGGTPKQYLVRNRCPGLELTGQIYIPTAWINHHVRVCPRTWLSLLLFLCLKAFVGKMKREHLTWAVGAAICPPPLPHCVAFGKSCNYTGTLFPSPETHIIIIPPLTGGFLWHFKPATGSAFLLCAFLGKKLP